MKSIDFSDTNKVVIGFFVIALIALGMAVGLFLGLLNSKPLALKVWGGIILAAASFLMVLITFVFDKRSSAKSDESLKNTSDTKNQVDIIDKKQDVSLQKLESLQNENSKLREDVINLQNEQIAKNKEILEKSADNIKLSETLQSLTTGGNSFPNLRHCQIAMYENGVQAQGDRLQVSIDLYNDGDYALDNVRIRGYQISDFRKMHPYYLWAELSLSGLNIYSRFAHHSKNDIFRRSYSEKNPPVITSEYEVLKAGHPISLDMISFKEPFEYYGVNIFIESKRQDWIILFRLYRPRNSTEPYAYQASKIMKITANGLENVIENIESGFPTGTDNKFIWFSEGLPKEWFSK